MSVAARTSVLADSPMTLGITWDEAHHLMARAVARGLARRPHVVPERDELTVQARSA